MFGEKPEISDTLEWMLQSRQVGDETLVNTIVQQEYAHLYTFILTISDSPDPGLIEEFIEGVIARAVDDANQYQGQTKVEVWLYQMAYQAIKTANMVQSSSDNKNGRYAGDQGAALEIWEAINRLEGDSRRACLLKFRLGLTDQEIGYVLDIPELQVKGLLGAAEQVLNQDAEYGEKTNFSHGEIEAALTERYPPPDLSPREELLVAGKILKSLKTKENRKRRVLVIWQSALVVVAILILVGLGRTITASRPDLSPVGTVLHTQLVNKIIYVSPTPGPTEPPTPFPEQAILYVANQGETLKDIGDRIFLNAEILAALNNIPLDQELDPGQQIIIGVSDSRVIMPTPIGATPVPQPTLPRYDPLTLNSSPEIIRERMLESRSNWQSLWANAYIIQYGPPGYVGDPDIRRQQIWITQPYFSYTLDGELNGEVKFITSALGGLINYINLVTGEQVNNTETELVHLRQDLQQLLVPSEFREDFIGDVEAIGVDEVAGRETLVFDWFSPEITGDPSSAEGSPVQIHQGRYWVDTNLGMILRRQKFNSNNIEQLFEEIIVSSIEFNVEIPHRLFDRSQPMQTYFAGDHKGDPSQGVDLLPVQIYDSQSWRAPMDHEPAPANYDPAGKRLRIQWTSLSSFDPEQGTRADLFANNYFLGNIEFADPNQIICTRSTNGNMVAFTNWSEDSRFGFIPLRWFKLSELPMVHQALPDIVPFDFVFAPDNRQLALYGCEQQSSGSCGIYIIDTQSLHVRKLTDVEQGSGLIWNPDSSQIAIQGSLLRRGKWRVLVFDTKSGTVVYDGPFDWEGFWVAPDSPIHDWGVEYPPIRGGLEICSEPPEGG